MTSTEASEDATAMLASPMPSQAAATAAAAAATSSSETPAASNNSTSTGASSSNKMIMSATKTPPRNNYHNPHTPIASIKRPRSSLQKAAAAGRNSMTPVRNTTTTATTPKEAALSPMHPVRPVHRENSSKTDAMVVEEEGQQQSPQQAGSSTTTAEWVGRKVDALFSPVLRFLDQQQDDEETDPSELAATTTSSNTSSPDSMVVTDPDHAVQADTSNNTTTDDNASTHSDASSLQGQGMPEHDSEEFNPWQFIESLPPYPHVSHLCPAVALPPKSPQAPPITLVLDLDETLVHCSVDPSAADDCDLEFPVQFHGCTYQVHVKLRPYLTEFLQAIAPKFEVVLFTASQKIYANELLNRIDPDGKYIQHRLFRESCLAVEGNFLKDLNVLGRDLRHTILVDNSPHAFGYQVDNGVPIESWFDDPADKELLKLERFLRQQFAGGCKDVRPVLRRKFGCQQLVQDAPPLPLYYTQEEEEYEQAQQQAAAAGHEQQQRQG